MLFIKQVDISHCIAFYNVIILDPKLELGRECGDTLIKIFKLDSDLFFPLCDSQGVHP